MITTKEQADEMIGSLRENYLNLKEAVANLGTAINDMTEGLMKIRDAEYPDARLTQQKTKFGAAADFLEDLDKMNYRCVRNCLNYTSEGVNDILSRFKN